jgi:hypothetical protein
MIIIPILKIKKWGTEKLSKVPKVTYLLNNTVGNGTQMVYFQNLYFQS